jgi:hypothetical protein
LRILSRGGEPQQHAFLLGVLEDQKLLFENAFDSFVEGLFRLAGHVFYGAAHPPKIPVIQVARRHHIAVVLVEDDECTGGCDKKSEFLRATAALPAKRHRAGWVVHTAPVSSPQPVVLRRERRARARRDLCLGNTLQVHPWTKPKPASVSAMPRRPWTRVIPTTAFLKPALNLSWRRAENSDYQMRPQKKLTRVTDYQGAGGRHDGYPLLV